MEFITQLKDADPVGLLVQELVDNWDTDNRVQALLDAVFMHRGGWDGHRSLEHIGSRVFLRERVRAVRCAYTFLRNVARGQRLSEITRPNQVFERLAEDLSDLVNLSEWLNAEPVRNAVDQVITATDNAFRMGNIQLVAVYFTTLSMHLPFEIEEELRVLGLLGHDMQAIGKQANLVQSFAHGRMKSLYTAEVAPALQAITELQVSSHMQEIKDLFTFTPEQIELLMHAFMGRDVDPNVFAPAEQQSTSPQLAKRETRPSGLIIVRY